ncbi:MAG: PD40 domain-containing protein [Gammaproteobacteria bacterium]|nr:PD40 domain-containing protein [Gammaproteobacteria bacterium]
MGKLYEELKKRKVFRVAAIYAVVAWVLIQVSDVVLPTFGAPEWVNQTIIFLFILGFIPTLIAAWAYELTPDGIKADTAALSLPTTASNTDRKLIYATFGLVLLVAGFQLSDRFLSNNIILVNRSAESANVTTNPAIMRSSIILNQPLNRSSLASRTLLDIAPDGSSLAFANIEDEHWMLRNLDTQETQVLVGTRNGKANFSPDSQKLLLLSTGPRAVGVRPVEGGSFQLLPIENTLSATWLSNEHVIYQHTDGDTRMLSIVDGTEDIIPGVDAAGDGYYVFNSLPSGSAFLYRQTQSTNQLNQSIIQAYDLNSQSKTVVTSDGYLPQYVNSGHVLFLREGDLWAVPFDAASLRVTGAEARVLEGVDSQRMAGWGAYSVSDSGRLVYLPGSEVIEDQRTLYWADRLGNREKIPLRAGNYSEPRLSPDGKLLAVASFQVDDSSDIWVYNFSSEAFVPITFLGNARNPVWTPDGARLVFQLNSSVLGIRPRGELWIINANGTGQAELILDADAMADSLSPIDEKLFYRIDDLGAGNINTLTFTDDAWVSAPLIENDNNTLGARVSPDGRWIAYGSNESGTVQIYVQPYPNLDGGKWQVSTEKQGSREPSWGPNGDEIFFLRLDGTLMHAKLTIDGDRFSFGVVEPLVTDLEMYSRNTTPNYLVSNDGERFLHFYSGIDEPDTGLDQDHTELVVISSFFEKLKQLAPPDPQ